MSETPTEPKQVYDQIAKREDFRELRKRYRGFAFPWTVAFMAWYLLFVICANWAPGLMRAQVAGNVNVAFIWGILQFASTFLIAWLYARHANKQLDPVADELNVHYRKEVGA